MIKAEWTNKDSLDLQPTCNQLATTDGDIISRQGAIDALQCEWCVEKINNLPSAEPKTGKWIPCSERLPEENGEYIVSLEDSVYPWANFFNGKWFMLSFNGIAQEFGEYEVIAWMPLPKPYREDGEA